jgi:hypothetical protein
MLANVLLFSHVAAPISGAVGLGVRNALDVATFASQ